MSELTRPTDTSKDQAETEHVQAETDVLVEAGFITTCREEVGDGDRCNERAEFVLWGKLFSPEALGPRCHFHACDHTDWTMPSRSSQWAVLDLRPILRQISRPAINGSGDGG